ncbi:divalent-cation tolerance protein CutA [Ramlibacter sp. MMS24-I3-19]|uniref:divalent-cation tolerance protein CutA n=1 Tax=Ramlibacter sp. MMS24-I3-19 TaxID=3416606 RepID=UPI003D08021E
MPSTAATQVLSLVTTVGGEDDARRLASALLDQRLAACVQVDRLESHYRWEGALCAEAEWRLTVKSAPDKLAALQAFLATQHPYELPQVVWQLLEATPAYAAWVRGEVDGLSAR